MQMSTEIAAATAQPARAKPTSTIPHLDAPKLDAWSALIAAAASPDDWIVIERDGELFIEPAPTRQ